MKHGEIPRTLLTNLIKCGILNLYSKHSDGKKYQRFALAEKCRSVQGMKCRFGKYIPEWIP